MRVVFRNARKSDIPLIRKFTVETGWKGITGEEQKRLDRQKWNKHMEKVFENTAKRKGSRIFVAEDEHRAFLGYLFVGESGNMMTGETYGFIYDIFVKEEFRGKGIGKMLVEKAENYCREKGYSRLSLMVSTSNQRAINLYTRMGLRPEQIYMGKELS
jgi:ribosomal protein S18 acetylase RimI-like enzyme